MYDDKVTEVQDKVFLLIAEIKRALSNGTKHYRKSDGCFLQTEREILEALIDEGCVTFEPVVGVL